MRWVLIALALCVPALLYLFAFNAGVLAPGEFGTQALGISVTLPALISFMASYRAIADARAAGRRR